MSITEKWKKVPQGWQIAIVFFLAAFALYQVIWPYIQDKFFSEHPDTYIYLVGQEHSYTINQLKEAAPIRSKIRLVPIKFPEGVSSVYDSDIPLKFFDWNYPENTKLYTIVAHNKGAGVDRNIKIEIDFTPNSIKFVEINHEERVSLIQGGKPTGTFAVFKIGELLPNEIQDIEILIEGRHIKSLNAWSENQQNIENIFEIDVIIEPDKEFAE